MKVNGCALFLVGFLLAGQGTAEESLKQQLARAKGELARLEAVSRKLIRLPALEIERAELADKIYTHARMRRDLGVKVSKVRAARAEVAEADLEWDQFWFGEFDFPGDELPGLIYAAVYRVQNVFRAPGTGEGWKNWRRICRRCEQARRNLRRIEREEGPAIKRMMRVMRSFAQQPFSKDETGTTFLAGRRVRKADLTIHDCRRRLKELDSEIAELKRFERMEGLTGFRWPGGERYRPRTLTEAIRIKRAEVAELEKLLRESAEVRYLASGMTPEFQRLWHAFLKKVTTGGRYVIRRGSFRADPVVLVIRPGEKGKTAVLSPFRLSVDLSVRDTADGSGDFGTFTLEFKFKEGTVDSDGIIRLGASVSGRIRAVENGQTTEKEILDQSLSIWRLVPEKRNGETYLLYGPVPQAPPFFRLKRSER